MNIDEAIAAIQQPRSRFQLLHFVLGQHDTPEMQFYQLCQELQDTGYKLRLAELYLRRTEGEIERLRATGDEIDEIDAEEKQVGMEQTRVVMLGARREMEVLQDLFDSVPHFSRPEIEHAQPEYWEKRLTRQTELQIMSGHVGWAQLDAMRQAGLMDDVRNLAGHQPQPLNGQRELPA